MVIISGTAGAAGDRGFGGSGLRCGIAAGRSCGIGAAPAGTAGSRCGISSRSNESWRELVARDGTDFIAH